MSLKREKLGFLSGDPVIVTGKRRGRAVRTPQMFVLFEDGAIELIPVRFIEPTTEEPGISTEDSLRASEQCAELYRNGRLRSADDPITVSKAGWSEGTAIVGPDAK
jgi:hypothetical protein